MVRQSIRNHQTVRSRPTCRIGSTQQVHWDGVLMAIRTPLGEFQDPASPVRRIPGEPVNEKPTEKIGLCLSGGGYRAMLFHLGALWRLNELAMIQGLDRVSSVSGGSITAAVLGMNWPRLEFNAYGVAEAFDSVVVIPIRALAARTIDLPAVLLGL